MVILNSYERPHKFKSMRTGCGNHWYSTMYITNYTYLHGINTQSCNRNALLAKSNFHGLSRSSNETRDYSKMMQPAILCVRDRRERERGESERTGMKEGRGREGEREREREEWEGGREKTEREGGGGESRGKGEGQLNDTAQLLSWCNTCKIVRCSHKW